MKRGSTPPITVTVPGVDLTGAEWVIVSLSRAGYKPAMELTGERLTVTYGDEATVIAFQLTQAESLALGPSTDVDVNWMLDGQRRGCVPQAVSLTRTLLNREVEANE